MKINTLNNILCALGLTLTVMSCSPEEIEAIAATDLQELSLLSDPGGIVLNWRYVSEENERTNRYVEIRYFDPKLKKEIKKTVSGEDHSIIFNNLSQEDDIYNFELQPFSSTFTPGKIRRISGKAGKVVQIGEKILAATDLKNLKVTPHVESIELNWDYKLGEYKLNTNSHVEIRYTDKTTGNAVVLTVIGTERSITINDLYAKDGEYTFELQPFSMSAVPGAVHSVVGTADKRPPVPATEILNLQTTALPGCVKLMWGFAIQTNTNKYIEIRYSDPETDQTIVRQIDGSDQMVLISNLKGLKKYSFEIQPFSSTSNPGKIVRTSMVTQANMAYKHTELPLTINDYEIYKITTSNYGGNKVDLIDNNQKTYVNMDFDKPELAPFYIDFTYSKPQSVLRFYYKTRYDNGYFPTKIQCFVKADLGDQWQLVKILTLQSDGLPTNYHMDFHSDFYETGMKFNYFRFKVLETTGGPEHPNFSLSEFKVYDVTAVQ